MQDSSSCGRGLYKIQGPGSSSIQASACGGAKTMGCNVDCVRLHPGRWRTANGRVVINYACGEIHVKKRTTTFSRCFSVACLRLPLTCRLDVPCPGWGGSLPFRCRPRSRWGSCLRTNARLWWLERIGFSGWEGAVSSFLTGIAFLAIVA